MIGLNQEKVHFNFNVNLPICTFRVISAVQYTFERHKCNLWVPRRLSHVVPSAYPKKYFPHRSNLLDDYIEEVSKLLWLIGITFLRFILLQVVFLRDRVEWYSGCLHLLLESKLIQMEHSNPPAAWLPLTLLLGTVVDRLNGWLPIVEIGILFSLWDVSYRV